MLVLAVPMRPLWEKTSQILFTHTPHAVFLHDSISVLSFPFQPKMHCVAPIPYCTNFGCADRFTSGPPTDTLAHDSTGFLNPRSQTSVSNPRPWILWESSSIAAILRALRFEVSIYGRRREIVQKQPLVDASQGGGGSFAIDNGHIFHVHLFVITATAPSEFGLHGPANPWGCCLIPARTVRAPCILLGIVY